MKRYFHEELQDIRSKVILIGEKSVEAARIAVKGFLENDLEQADYARKLDDEIDQLELDIGHAAVRYTILRSPVSSDMRLIFVAIKASRDLERAGDEAHSIAKKTRDILRRNGRVPHTAQIEPMSQLAFEMMQDAITCLVEEDLDQAYSIIDRDKKVDQMNRENFEFLSTKMGNDADINASCVQSILISKSIERIGDHAKNLAEEVIYLLTGE
ncbi:MAG: phosphate signaling complex protein PhoU [Opitutales bacterium]